MVGQEVCRLLTENGQSVRALVRSSSDPAKKNLLKKMGAELAVGDLRDATTLKAALSGVNTVITTASSMPFSYVPGNNNIQKVDREGIKSLIDHAKESGIHQFIYTSFSKQIDLDFPLRNAKREVEEYLKQSGLTYTILRPSFFMEVWLSPAVGFDAENGKVSLCGDGTSKVSYISLADVAKFIVASVDHPAAKNTEIELGGPDGVSQLEAVDIFAATTGKKIELHHTPLEALHTQRMEAEDPMQQSFSGLMECLAQGDYIEMQHTLQEFPIKLISVQEYAQ